MTDLDGWLQASQILVNGVFEGRVVFIGLQGSRARGEGTEYSDIDVVLILDQVTMDDLARYRDAVEQLPDRKLLCGFVSGSQELRCWSEPDLFQFAMDTRPLQGSLEGILPTITQESARQAALLGACTLYHACSHNFLHTRDVETLKSLYKSAFFTLQADQYCRTGVYPGTRRDMEQAVAGQNRQVLEVIVQPSAINERTFDEYSGLLLGWASWLIRVHG